MKATFIPFFAQAEPDYGSVQWVNQTFKGVTVSLLPGLPEVSRASVAWADYSYRISLSSVK